MRFVVLLDACVLYPAPLRDFLMRLATTGLFAAKWTAIRCSAQIIVTFNLKDFPQDSLDPYGLESMHPDIFVEHQLDLHQGSVIGVAKQHRAALTHPAKAPDEYLETLSAQGLVVTADRLREFVDLI